MTDPLIECHGVTVRRGGEAVLDAVEIAVMPGEMVSLIGPNGAGKTLLLRVLLDLLRPDEGKVASRPGLRVGYMPQKLELDATLPLTVRRFLSLGGPVPPGQRREVLEEVGISALADRPMRALSGGETQRVLFARALLRDPDLLVMDEPAQGLDIHGQDELMGLIEETRRRRDCGILMVSHDLHVVMAATDRVVCLNHHICCTGHPLDVEIDPSYVALFGERGVGHLAAYQHHHDHVHGLAGEVVGADGGHDRGHGLSHPGHSHPGHSHRGHSHGDHSHGGSGRRDG
jgi:zinc transport system ATP-binding protein